MMVMRAGGEQRLMYLVAVLKQCAENGCNREITFDGKIWDVQALADELELACEEIIYAYRQVSNLLHIEQTSSNGRVGKERARLD